MPTATVLQTITGLNVGGAEIMLMRFLGALGEGYDCQVLSLMPPSGAVEHFGPPGLRVDSIGMRQNAVTPLDLLALRRAVRAAGPDLLHGWMYHGNLAATIGSWRIGHKPPVIWSIHHSLTDITREKPLTRGLVRLSARLSRSVAAISYCSAIAAEQHEALGFEPARRIVIPNGVDCNQFRPDPTAKTRLEAILGIPTGRTIIGTFGRSHPMKDHVNMATALAELVGKGLDVHGLFVGVSEKDCGLRDSVRDLGIGSRVTICGTRNDLTALAPGLDVYVLSSGWGEAFSVATSEAMASGVPAVVTDVGDSAWLVGDTGTVVPPRDSAALAAAIGRLVAITGDDRRALGARARARIQDNFSLTQYVNRHRALYDDVLERRGT